MHGNALSASLDHKFSSVQPHYHHHQHCFNTSGNTHNETKTIHLESLLSLRQVGQLIIM